MRLVNGFQHIPGIHCGSTALRDMLHYIGLEYSESVCLGLGGGLSFLYYQSPTGKPVSRLLYGRTISLERDLCVHHNLVFREGTADDPRTAWQEARAWIDRDVPVLLHVELSLLPYYRTRTPFPGHRVLLVGYDDDRETAFLADTAFPDLQTVSYDTLASARSAKIQPIPLHNEWMVIERTPPDMLRPLPNAVRHALRANALGMNLDRAPHQGIMGMESVAEDLSRWGDLPDWEVCARFAYQNIEVRGTGGGMFRKMYAEYLQQVEPLDQELQAAGLAALMSELADEWSALGSLFQRTAVEGGRSLFQDAGRAMRRLAAREEYFWGRVLKLEE